MLPAHARWAASNDKHIALASMHMRRLCFCTGLQVSMGLPRQVSRTAWQTALVWTIAAALQAPILPDITPKDASLQQRGRTCTS